MHPQRPKLVDQICRELQDGIESRRWVEWLPQERYLARDLKVGRSTLRLALQRLRADGLLEGLHSKGNRILGRRFKSPRKGNLPLTVNLVVPSAVSRLRPSPVEWIDKLSAQLAAHGGQLRVLPADACYVQRPARVLEKLTQRNPADCWLVRLSTLPMQEWLAEHHVPAILIGTPHLGIELPYIDIDHRALSRHAMGVLLAAGHRRITLFTDSDLKGGDIESERGFTEAAATIPQHPDVKADIVRFEGSVAGMIRRLDGLLREPGRPTALLVPHAIYCLTIWSHLGACGLRVPRDLSVIAHLGMMHLSYLTPEPAHYQLNSATYVEKILRAILARVTGVDLRQNAPLLPEFVRGGSIGPPRG